MLGKLQKHLRTFVRDYWNRELQPGEKMPLKHEMILSGAIMVAAWGGLSFLLPSLVPALAIAATLSTATLFTMQLHKISKETKEFESAELHLCGKTDRKVVLSGPGRAVRVVANTQLLLERATKLPFSYLRTEAHNEIAPNVLRRLAPYFNDCAEAAAQLEATVDGKPVERFALTHFCVLDDKNAPDRYWHREVQPLLTRDGLAKKLSADKRAAGHAAASQIERGIGQKIRIKPIKLKVMA